MEKAFYNHMNIDLLNRLKASCITQDDIPPKGFKTRLEWQAEWKNTRSIAMALITAGLKDGILEKQMLMKGGRRTPYYGEPIKYKSTKPKR
jgi:hypothetical protein